VDPAIETRALTKFYGPHRGVEALDLKIERGEIFGFLGPNGAGKTTTIRILLDLIRPTSGRAEILGMNVRERSLEVRARTGYLPGELALYEYMTGAELLEHFAKIRETGTENGLRVSERLGLDLTRRISTLSKGNKQKVGIAQALVHDPDLLILDEPTSGLDPLVQNEFHQMVRERAQEGKTVFLSSHALSEVEHVAHRVGIIRSGRLAVVEDVAALKARAVRRVEVIFGSPPPPRTFEDVAGVREVTVEGSAARFTIDGSVDALIKAIAPFEVTDIVSDEADLEEIFLSYYQDTDEN
jgi:ABC-2 type transport system ATP-binding protein